MLQMLWRYAKGYVIIEARGFSIERFINLIIHKGVAVWDMKMPKDASRFCVSLRDFRRLEEPALKTGCELTVVGQVGLPFFLKRYRKRKMLAFGAILFISGMFFLSSFVWLVSIHGNKRVSSSEITEFLATEGFHLGSFKYAIDERAAEAALLKRFPDISWVNVHIRGTRADITLTETIKNPPIIDSKTPADIIAGENCVIDSIALSTGTPKVHQGDIVRKGDVLVEGLVTAGGEDLPVISSLVHAKAEIRGKRYYKLSFFVDLNHYTQKYTGKVKHGYSIIVFDNELDLPKPVIDFSAYDIVTKRTQLNFGEDYPLPIVIRETTYRDYEKLPSQRSENEAKATAETMLMDAIIQNFSIDADIMEKKISYSIDDDKLYCEVGLTVVENIGITVQRESIPLEPENEPEKETEKEAEARNSEIIDSELLNPEQIAPDLVFPDLIDPEQRDPELRDPELIVPDIIKTKNEPVQLKSTRRP